MKNIKKIVACCFFISVFFISLSYSQDMQASTTQQNAGKKNAEERFQNIYNQLNLTDEQKKLIEENKNKNHQAMKNSREQLKSLRESLKTELTNLKLDINKIEEIKAKLKAAQDATIDNRVNSILEIRKILTPEQFIKFNSLVNETHKNRGGHKMQASEKEKDEK